MRPKTLNKKTAYLFLGVLLCLLNSSCNHLFYYPNKEVLYPPENLKITYEAKTFTSLDGTQLTAWYFPSPHKKPKGTIIQFHGNAENMTSHYLSLVWLTKEGFDLFTFDYRGYGKSEGEPNPKGTVEDGIAAIREVLKIHGTKKNKNKVVIAWGQSLGGAILQRSIEDLTADEKQQLDLIILDSTFSSYKTVAASALRKSAITWLISPLAYVLVSNAAGAHKFYTEIKTPTLIVHDELDQAVPFSNGEDLDTKIENPNKTFWHPRLGGHIRTFAADRPEWRQKLLQFLESTKR